MKYKNQIIQSAEEWVRKNGLMDYGGGQLKDFIKYLGIDDKTWRKWYAEKEEFRRAIDRAKEDYKRSLAIELHQTLAQAAMGGEHEETTTEYRPNSKEPDRPTITKMVKKKTFTPPNVGAAIFLLTNLDPEHYQQRQRTDIALKSGDEKEMTLEEINAEIERLSKLNTKE